MSKHGLEDGEMTGKWSVCDIPGRPRKKRSRWAASETEKAFVPGMPTVIPPGLSKEQEEMYLLQLQIEEISRRLRTGELGIPSNPDERSPSPEPIYNTDGKRLNTREYRTRKRLEEERHSHVTKAMTINPDYKPPADYKAPIIRITDKVMIPQEEHPDINFVGLIIGPRGNTLKNLEKETGAKIIIRGKGSVKEGKIGRKDGQPLPGEDEPLHAWVTASNPEHVQCAVDKIKEMIRQGIEVPEGQNDLRRQQLRELAQLNGTLRENDALSKLKQIQEAQNIITNTIFCSVCGGAGHLSQDCKQKRPGDTFRELQARQAAGQTVAPVDKAKMDSEYMSLMAELGEGPPPAKTGLFNRMPWSGLKTGSATFTGLALPAPKFSAPTPPMPPISQPAAPPPMLSQRPWSSMMSSAPPVSGPPPGSMVSAPMPPPPPISHAPWQHPPRPPHYGNGTMTSMPPPRHPPHTTSAGGWDFGAGAGVAVAPVPPPPTPPRPPVMAPWQHPPHHGFSSPPGYTFGGVPPPPPPT